ncbi:MAG: hypothetical protein ABI609_02520 [Acidobacteriota bacterium]
MSGWSLWQGRWRIWVPALLFFALNVGGWLLYEFAYRDRVTVLEERLIRLQGHRQSLTTRRTDLEARLALVNQNRKDIESLYSERLATERERLTRTLAEFKTLATRAGLQPQSVSYPEVELAQFGLVKKSIVFGVDGDYNSLRQLIHLLELSPTFFSLEEVRLNNDAGGSSPQLHIALQIATLFVNDRPMPRTLTPGVEPREPKPAPPTPPTPRPATEDGP